MSELDHIKLKLNYDPDHKDNHYAYNVGQLLLVTAVDRHKGVVYLDGNLSREVYEAWNKTWKTDKED